MRAGKTTILIPLLLFTGCVSASVQGSVETTEVSDIRDPWEYEYFRGWYDALHTEFGVPNQNDGDEHRKFTSIIDPFFTESMLISIEDRPDYATNQPGFVINHQGYIRLWVSFFDSKNTTIDSNPTHQHNSKTRDLYQIDIDRVEFDSLFQNLATEQFASLPTLVEVSGCTDGTQSFLFSQNGDTTHFVSRHNCNPTYKADISISEPLLFFAVEKMPYLREKLSGYWKRETGQDIQKK